MPRRHAAAIALLMLLTFPAQPSTVQSVSGTAATPSTVRDRRLMSTSQSALHGRVIDGVTGVPVPRAKLMVRGARAEVVDAVVTGADGNFSVTNLPAGGYTIFVEKPTYLLGRFPVRSKSLRQMQREITLGDGQVIKDLTLSIYRGGAITGRVLNREGDAVDRVEVRVLKASQAPDASLAPVGVTQTNDIGEFRVGRLDPGSYLVLAMSRTAGGESARGPVPATQALPTYYPGALDPAFAQVVTVDAAQASSGIDIMLVEGTQAVVNGRVVREDGGSLGRVGFISTRRSAGNQHASSEVLSTRLNADGSFRLVLTPGEYVLDARVADALSNSGSVTEYLGRISVSLGEGGTEDVIIPVGPGGSVAGEIVFPSGARPPHPAGARLQILASGTGGCRSGAVTIASNWTFRITGLAGDCVAQHARITGAWTTKSIVAGGQNLVGQTLTFAPGTHLANVQVHATDRSNDLAIRVTDDDGRQTREYVALAFPALSTLWTPNATAIRTFVPDAADSPEILKSLAPGEYCLVAVDDISMDDIRDRGTLERLSRVAVRITLPDRAATNVTVRRVRFADIGK